MVVAAHTFRPEINRKGTNMSSWVLYNPSRRNETKINGYLGDQFITGIL